MSYTTRTEGKEGTLEYRLFFGTIVDIAANDSLKSNNFFRERWPKDLPVP
jgi:hypothetical protein